MYQASKTEINSTPQIQRWKKENQTKNIKLKMQPPSQWNVAQLSSFCLHLLKIIHTKVLPH